MASVFGFRIFTHDVTQAYLQNESTLTLDVLLNPKREDKFMFELRDGEILKLILPLCGMGDSKDYWIVTVDKHTKQDLGMRPMASDPSLYIVQQNGSVEGLKGVYVDEFLLAGEKSFQVLTEATIRKFDSREREWENVEFFGNNINSAQNKYYSVDQTKYCNRLVPLPTDVSLQSFRSKRSEVPWLTNSRPDICCAANRAAQVQRIASTMLP